MPLLKRIRVMAAAIESDIGTAESLTATEGVYNAYDVSIQPTIETEQREGQGGFNYLSGVPGRYMGTASFKTEVSIGSGQPTWASVLLPACGFVASATVYTPRSEAPGSNVKTATIGVFENGVFKSIAGAVGTFRLICPTGRMAFIEWTFQGVWQAVTDTAIITPTYPTAKPIRFASGTCTYAAVDQKVENVTLDAANNIVLREDPATEAGYISGIVTDRYPRITANPETDLVANDDKYGDWLAATEAAFAITLTGPSSSSLAVSAPKAQIFNSQEGDRDKLQIDDVEWACNKNGATHDQEVSLTVTPES